MLREQLPLEVQEIFPDELVRIIHSYIPYRKKKKSPTTSPSLQKELTRIQNTLLRGKSAMYMKDLIDFCLD